VRKNKKILLWITGILGLFLALVAALFIITPRVINKDFVRQSIEDTILGELGGTLTYDRIELTFLPRPRILVRKPKLVIPGSISGSLKSLDIYPAILPLISGNFQIAKILLDSPMITLVLPGEAAALKTNTTTRGAPIDAILETAARKIPDIELIVEHGQLTLLEDQRKVFVLSDLETLIIFRASLQAGDHPPGTGSKDNYQIAGNTSFKIIEEGAFPGALQLTIEQFEALPGTLSFTRARAKILDSSFTLSGRFNDYFTALRKADLSLKGKIGADTVRWIMTKADLPPTLTVRAPLTVSRARLRWNRAGSTQIAGSATLQSGAALSFDIALAPERIAIKELSLRDEESDAYFSLKRERQVLDLSFKGNLTQSMLDRFFVNPLFQFGWIKGDFRAHVNNERPGETTAEGTLEGGGLVVPHLLKTPFTIDRLTLTASGPQILLNPVALTLGKEHLMVNGSIAVSEDGIKLDVDLASERFDWDTIQNLLTPDSDKNRENEASAKTRAKLPVLGQLRISLDALSAGTFTAQNLRAVVSLENDRTSIKLNEAIFCGISLPGTITITPEDVRLDFRPMAKNQDLEPVLVCLTGKDLRVTGSFDLSGDLAMAAGKKETLLQSLHGNLLFETRKGRMFRDPVVVRVLTFLSVSDLIKGNYAKIEMEGLPYDSFLIRAEILNGNISVNEAVLKSRAANMTGRGDVDLQGKTLNLRIWVAPFTNVDAVVSKVPLVGDVVGSSLVSIPVTIRGPFNDPEVKVLR